MWFFSLLRNPKQCGLGQRRRTPAVSRQRSTFRPQLEALEDRCVPSTLKVTNNFDSGAGSLRYEIAQATSKDTIVFDKSLDGATITLTTGEMVINKNLTIKGPGAGLLTITSIPWVDSLFTSRPGSRVFEVDGANTTFTLSGLTIGNAGGTTISGYFALPYDGWGGGILNFGNLTLSSCTLSSDSAIDGGGAIANYGNMTVSGSTLSGSFSQVGVSNFLGGGIYNAGTMTVSASNIAGLTPGMGGDLAYQGGGIYNAGTMTLSGCTVSGNYALNDGGGIYNAGTMRVSGCTVSGNHAGLSGFTDGGGGIYNAGTLTVSNSVLSGNTPDNIFGTFIDGGGNIFK
jgi:hypothetical protein